MTEAKNPLTLLDLGEKYVTGYLVGLFNEGMISKFQVIREVLYECYKTLTARKELTAIEDLDGTEKQTLWNECKKYVEPLSSTERIKFVKAYWALCCLMQKRV